MTMIAIAIAMIAIAMQAMSVDSFPPSLGSVRIGTRSSSTRNSSNRSSSTIKFASQSSLAAAKENDGDSNWNSNSNNNSHDTSTTTTSISSSTTTSSTSSSTRRSAIARLASVSVSAAAVATNRVLWPPQSALANDESDHETTSTSTGAATAATAPVLLKLELSDQDLLDAIVATDLVANQFLVSGKLTRAFYDETALFADEIDTYTLDQWIKGTSRLFDASRSRVELVPNSARVVPGATNNNNNNNTPTSNTTNTVLQFQFVEYLCFNIPLIKPIAYLSGTLFLERSPTTGLITSYREKWDQDANTVVTKNSKLFTNKLTNQELDRDLQLFAAKMGYQVSK